MRIARWGSYCTWVRRVVVGLSIIALVSCSESASETPIDGTTPPRRDSGPTFVDGSADLRSFPDADPGCAGEGCPCETDTPCLEGADQTICGPQGTCIKGCNANVPCVGDDEKCCDNACIEGCCDNSDCPEGEGLVCDPTTHSCGACEEHTECGSNGRCCGETGSKSCVLGNCCAPDDCTVDGET